MFKDGVLENEKNEFAPQAPARGSGGRGPMSVVLIGPDVTRRLVAADAFNSSSEAMVKERLPYPTNLDDVPRLLSRPFDIIAVDLDSDREFALDLVSRICAQSQATVMAYTEYSDVELLVRCMWAGAREFLTLPVAPAALADALARAAARQPSMRVAAKALGKLLVFSGCKGGTGVTSVACDFALAVARFSKQETLLIDLDLPLGDAAIHLGVRSDHSTISALEDYHRLDPTLFANLLAKHDSGLWVLSSPGQFVNSEVPAEAVEKLLTVARQNFDYVIVDAGSMPGVHASSIFKEASTIYLVAQVGVSELRNANRIITRYFASSGPRLQIVLNRYTQGVFGIDEEHIVKALTKAAQWKVPTDPPGIQKAVGSTLVRTRDDSPMVREINRMAKNACGIAAEGKSRGWFHFSSHGEK
jgi:pilus assembly protein CpaE